MLSDGLPQVRVSVRGGSQQHPKQRSFTLLPLTSYGEHLTDGPQPFGWIFTTTSTVFEEIVTSSCKVPPLYWGKGCGNFNASLQASLLSRQRPIQAPKPPFQAPTPLSL